MQPPHEAAEAKPAVEAAKREVLVQAVVHTMACRMVPSGSSGVQPALAPGGIGRGKDSVSKLRSG